MCPSSGGINNFLSSTTISTANVPNESKFRVEKRVRLEFLTMETRSYLVGRSSLPDQPFKIPWNYSGIRLPLFLFLE